MLKIIAAAFAGLALALTAAAVPWRHLGPADTDADPASLSVNDIVVNVDVKSFLDGKFEDASLVFPSASDRSKASALPQAPEPRK